MTFKDELREKLSVMNETMTLYLTSHSDVVQARVVATELGKTIRVKKVNDRQWALTLRPPRNVALMVTNPRATTSEYQYKMLHWANRMTPVGASGIPKHGLAWYDKGHQDIPDNWIIYVEEFDMIFKPRYVVDPTELLNDKLINAGLPPTRIFLDENFNKLPEDQAEERFKFIRERNKA